MIGLYWIVGCVLAILAIDLKVYSIGVTMAGGFRIVDLHVENWIGVYRKSWCSLRGSWRLGVPSGSCVWL